MTVKVSPDGKKVYASCGRAGTVCVVDAATCEVLNTIKVGTRPWGLALSPDGKLIAFLASSSADSGARLELWVRSLDSLEARKLAQGEASIVAAAPFWSPDGRFVAFVAGSKLKKADVAGGPGTRLNGNPMYAGRLMSFFNIQLCSIVSGLAWAAVDEYKRIITTKNDQIPPFRSRSRTLPKKRPNRPRKALRPTSRPRTKKVSRSERAQERSEVHLGAFGRLGEQVEAVRDHRCRRHRSKISHLFDRSSDGVA